ncbi:MAG: hypothetical protein JW809_09110 [Pirellulales bacterium]|nr:hypothetical protein [Pirellulales bacterium]
MDYWAIALLVLALSMAVAVLEVFFPSGGLLAFLCVALMITSIVLGFQSSTAWGFGILSTAIVGLPITVMIALNLLPNTPFGRKIILDAPTPKDVLPDDGRQESLKSLVGRTGRAKSRMLPAGVVKIGGRTIDAVTEGVPAEPGQAVRVIEVRGNRVLVRLISESELAPEPSAHDPLDRPIDQIAADPFDDSNPPAG